MKKIINNLSLSVLLAIVFIMACACGNLGGQDCATAEKVKLQNVVLNEVEFTNSDTVTLIQECDDVRIGGTISAMTDAQKNVYGTNDVTHVVALNVLFDKERTLSYVELKGNVTKVYSTNSEDANYVGKLTDLLDNESGEDAFSNIILSANSKNYTITAKYTDGHSSTINIIINATLVTAEAE